MKVATAILLLASAPAAAGAATNQACARSKGAGPDIEIHGRLSVYNGGYPNYRLWHIGSKHIYGIVQDERDRDCLKSTPCYASMDGPKLPRNVEQLLDSAGVTYWRMYGDYLLRPLAPYVSGHQQAACLLSANNLVLGTD